MRRLAALLDYLEHMQSTQLTDEQVAEVRRRLEDQNPTLVTLDEVKAAFLGAAHESRLRRQSRRRP